MNESNLDKSINNIDYFNIVTGFVLSQLYRNFPVPMDINASDFTLTMLLESDTLKGKCLSWHYEDLDNEFELVAAIINWLIEEDYIRCTSNSSGILFCQCVLSSKGLQTLSTSESSSNTNESIGDKIALAVEGGVLDTVKDLTKTVVCEGGKFLIQSALDSFFKAALHT